MHLAFPTSTNDMNKQRYREFVCFQSTGGNFQFSTAKQLFCRVDFNSRKFMFGVTTVYIKRVSFSFFCCISYQVQYYYGT